MVAARAVFVVAVVVVATVVVLAGVAATMKNVVVAVVLNGLVACPLV